MTRPKVALITGVTGQDGAYLAELLLDKGYEVHGIKRRASLFNTDRIDHLYQDPHVEHQRFILHYGDLTDSTNLIRIVQQVQPDEIYNLAAQSHVAVSFETPEYTANADGIGTLRLLEAIRILGLEKKTRFYQASTSELYGLVQEIAADGDHALLPAQPLRGGQALRLLDHRQLPRGLRPVRLQRHPLQPREPAARRDLRHAQDHARHRAHRARPAGLPVPGQPERAARLGPCRDYVEMQWLMLQQEQPEDFVIATGVQYSVRQFVEMAARELGIRCASRATASTRSASWQRSKATRPSASPAT